MVITEQQTEESAPEVRYVPGPKGLEILNAAGVKMSKTLFYAGLHSGQIPHIRVGKLFFVREDIVEVMTEKA